MPAEGMAGVMAEVAVIMVDMLSKHMPPATLRVDTLVSVLAVDVLIMSGGQRVEKCAMQVAHIIGTAAATGPGVIGEAVIGEAVTGIHPMGIPGLAITAGVMVIRTTDIIRGDTTLIATDTGRT